MQLKKQQKKHIERSTAANVSAYLVKHAAACWHPHELAGGCNLAPLKLRQRRQRSGVFHPVSNESTLCQCALAGRCKKSRGDGSVVEQLLDNGGGNDGLQV